MKRLTLKAINAELAKDGQEMLVRGQDYFYFVGGEAHTWPDSSVYVKNLSQLTLKQWVDERNRLRLGRTVNRMEIDQAKAL